MLPCREPGDHRAAQLGDHAPREGVHLLREASHRRVGVGVAEAHDAQLGLPVRQLLQGRRQLGSVLHRADHRELVHGDARIGRVRHHARDRLAVVGQRAQRDLEIHIAREGGVGGDAATVRPLRRTLGGADRVADAEGSEPPLRRAQIGLGAVELVFQDRRELGEPLPLQVRCRRHEALRDRVHRPGHDGRIRATALDAHEVPVRPRADPQLLGELLRRVAGRRHRVLNARAGPQHRCGRDPGEPERGAHGVANGALLQHNLRVDVKQPEAVRGGGHLEPVTPGSDVARHGERRQRRAVGGGLRLEVEAPLPHDIVEHDVRPEQVEPSRRRAEQLPALERSLVPLVSGLIRDLEPHRGPGLVRRLEEPRPDDACERADARHGDDEPPVRPDRRDDAAPVLRRWGFIPARGETGGRRCREHEPAIGRRLLGIRGGVARHRVWSGFRVRRVARFEQPAPVPSGCCKHGTATPPPGR